MINSITQSVLEDADVILELYAHASDYQRQKEQVVWPEFSKSFVIKEIEEGKQWKILVDGEIACVWAVAFEDPQIWGGKGFDSAIYLHRICINPNMRGQGFVNQIVEWAKRYSTQNDIKYIRMDTMLENKGLINHYTKCGFDFLGMHDFDGREKLPLHYQNGLVALFEITVN